MRCPDSAALIQNRNQGFPTIEKHLLGSKTHISCLSYFLWLENREGGGAVLGAGWVERQLQGDSGGGEDRLELSRETRGWPGLAGGLAPARERREGL